MPASDLTDLASVKAYLGYTAADSPRDQLLGTLITNASSYIYQRTARAALNQVLAFTEKRDGNGADELLLRERPIVSVVSLSIDGVSVPPSTDGLSGGYLADDRRILLLPGAAPSRFCRGRQNVSVSYTAGFASTPADLQQAATELVAQKFKRRDWVDQASKNMTTGEVLLFRSWEVPPEVERTIQAYKRREPLR